MTPTPRSITHLLRHVQAKPDDHESVEELFRRLESDLKGIAAGLLRRSPGGTLSATMLIDDAFLQLIDSDYSWEDRRQFFRLAAGTMKRLVTRYYRRRRPDSVPVECLDRMASPNDEHLEWLEFTRAFLAAMANLQQADPDGAEVFELYYFGNARVQCDADDRLILLPQRDEKNLTFADVARMLQRPLATVHHQYQRAKLYLKREMGEFAPEGDWS